MVAMVSFKISCRFGKVEWPSDRGILTIVIGDNLGYVGKVYEDPTGQ